MLNKLYYNQTELMITCVCWCVGYSKLLVRVKELKEIESCLVTPVDRC